MSPDDIQQVVMPHRTLVSSALAQSTNVLQQSLDVSISLSYCRSSDSCGSACSLTYTCMTNPNSLHALYSN
jgi:hypothetical protein